MRLFLRRVIIQFLSQSLYFFFMARIIQRGFQIKGQVFQFRVAHHCKPVFRRSTRKVPAFSSSHFFTFSPEPRLFLYLRHIFNALWGLFLLKIFLEYSIIMVLYGTLLGGELWRTFYDRKKRKKDSICKCMTPTGTRR